MVRDAPIWKPERVVCGELAPQPVRLKALVQADRQPCNESHELLTSKGVRGREFFPDRKRGLHRDVPWFAVMSNHQVTGQEIGVDHRFLLQASLNSRTLDVPHVFHS